MNDSSNIRSGKASYFRSGILPFTELEDELLKTTAWSSNADGKCVEFEMGIMVHSSVEMIVERTVEKEMAVEDEIREFPALPLPTGNVDRVRHFSFSRPYPCEVNVFDNQ